MLHRGSPKFNMMQAASKQKKPSPRTGGVQKKKPSPKVDRTRASWNLGLEKGLVELLHYHNNDCYRSQNGWSSEAWNRIVKLFQEKFTYVRFTKAQIQEKEKELKRDYNLLKEAKRQSGIHWDGTLGIISAAPPVWDNIIMSHPKARKFQTKPFPLFETLGELYDGRTAEGSLNFTSLEPRASALESVTQLSDSEPTPSEPASITQAHQDDHDDDPVMIVERPVERSVGTTMTSSGSGASRRAEEPAAPNANEGKKLGKKQKQEHVAGMMERYLDMKTKQVEGELTRKARALSEADDFSIKKCISVVNTIEELSGEEKAEAFDVFKDAQNREIFMIAEPTARLIWLRKKMVQAAS